MTDAATGDERQRVDKWLWYARFFKTRSLASKYVIAGRIRLDSVKIVKSSHTVRIGDVLTFPLRDHIRVIRIVDLGTRRGPAPEAQALYEDLDPPQPKSRKADALSALVPTRDRGSGRPTKKDRRLIDAFDELHRASDHENGDPE